MKKLTLILFVVLFSCAEERVAPSFDSLEGWWSFKDKRASGTFEVVDYQGDVVVDNGSGNTFSIDGNSYPVMEKRKLIGTLKREIFLINSNKAIISFYEAEYDKDYTKLTAKYWTINLNGTLTVIDDTITITR